MSGPATLELIAALGRVADRPRAALELARHLGVEEFLVLVRDPAVRIMLPAPGFPQTLRGGASWRDLVKACAAEGRRESRIEMPAGRWRDALAVTGGNACAILVGGTPREEAVADLVRLLPLLSALLSVEHEVLLARADAAQAKGAAVRAEALAGALEEARAEGMTLNAKLREEHRQKDNFLAMLAHELRNPLTPLVVSIELMRRVGLDAPAAGRQLDVMARQVRQLSRLVEELLDVSRVSRGHIELRRRVIALDQVIRDAVDANRPVLEARRNAIEVRMPREHLLVDGDSVRLAQVFGNLLHNAAKFTDPGGHISIEARREDGAAVVVVRDDGVGIPPEILPGIFNLFTQAPVSLARSQGGLGIGLTLVQALVELHGGRVNAQSEGVGKGSAFTIRLPLAAGAQQPDGIESPGIVQAEHALRVLVVDDNRDAAESLAMVLRLSGHHAETAFSGTEALQVAPDFDPDLVLLDIGLPEMDGHEVARRLRRLLPHGVRLVAITGYGTPEDRRRSSESGFDEHLVKPVLPEALAQVASRAQRTRVAG